MLVFAFLNVLRGLFNNTSCFNEFLCFHSFFGNSLIRFISLVWSLHIHILKCLSLVFVIIHFNGSCCLIGLLLTGFVCFRLEGFPTLNIFLYSARLHVLALLHLNFGSLALHNLRAGLQSEINIPILCGKLNRDITRSREI